jgi:hypothetical protein
MITKKARWVQSSVIKSVQDALNEYAAVGRPEIHATITKYNEYATEESKRPRRWHVVIRLTTYHNRLKYGTNIMITNLEILKTKFDDVVVDVVKESVATACNHLLEGLEGTFI